MPDQLHPVTAARRLRKMTQGELAAAAGITRVGMSHIETGYSAGKARGPHRATRKSIAAALGFSEADLWPNADKGEKVPSVLQAIIDKDARSHVRRRVRPRRLAPAQVKKRGWSTEKTAEYGWASEAEYNEAYLRQDPASWKPLVVEGVAEQPPRWFVKQVQAARRTAPARAPQVTRSQGRARARREPRKAAKQASGSSDAPPGHTRPASGLSTQRKAAS